MAEYPQTRKVKYNMFFSNLSSLKLAVIDNLIQSRRFYVEVSHRTLFTVYTHAFFNEWSRRPIFYFIF